MATHVRIVVRDSQCTGGPDFQGESNPDADPVFNPDCDTEASSPDRRVLNPPKQIVRAAELQVFSGPVAPPREAGRSQLQAVAREIFKACPQGAVPRNSRQDDNGNIHEFALDCMVWYDIAKGTSATQYEPRLPVSRAQMASFVARLIEESGGTLPRGTDAFGDDNGNVHEANINKLAAAGIIDGKSKGVYDPLGTVSRGQMAKFLVGAYHFRSDNLLAGSGDYFEDDNGTTHEINITGGRGAASRAVATARLRAGLPVLRDQMSSNLAALLDLLVEEGKPREGNNRADRRAHADGPAPARTPRGRAVAFAVMR
jgi:hypothetical protein